MNYNDVLEISPFSLNKEEKSKLFTEYLKELSLKHYQKCENYRKIVEKLYRNTFFTCQVI